METTFFFPKNVSDTKKKKSFEKRKQATRVGRRGENVLNKGEGGQHREESLGLYGYITRRDV